MAEHVMTHSELRLSLMKSVCMQVTQRTVHQVQRFAQNPGEVTEALRNSTEAVGLALSSKWGMPWQQQMAGNKVWSLAACPRQSRLTQKATQTPVSNGKAKTFPRPRMFEETSGPNISCS